MELSKTYNPGKVEAHWYKFWSANGFFHAEPDPEKEPFTITIPPPNVTGVLHMGHMLNNTIQDILVRRARMQGKAACWVPGTDHASIATEAKVVKMLKDKHGIEKKDISREQFLEHAWEWKEKYGGIILEQLKKLGASCDWQRTSFTMDEGYAKDVIKVFVKLYNKGYIYRGVRMVNWDPQGKTALSDEEVIYREVNSKLYYVRYPIKGTNDFVTIATTRPETILADTAICVNPSDERFKHLVGKMAIVPKVEREVPIIADDYVDPEYGTGCLKVTPAHDLNDYEIGLRHNLAVIDIIDDDGKINEKAGFYIGEDRFKARKLIAKDLEAAGLMVKVEEMNNKVGFSERTDAVIEPKLSMQWFMKMEELAKPALVHVEDGTIRFHPDKFRNTYRHWMENIRDWCISRQLWWGHQIPAYYLPDGSFVVAETTEEALALAREKHPNLQANDLRQDEDVLDTWASSWLWPISVFNGISEPDNPDIRYFYPTSDLVTAPEILFFWVARMIMAGYALKDQPPFKNVYLTGIVRDAQRRKMSKSLGNSPDPLALIEQYGADGVRTGMLFSSPAGNDLLFDEKLCEQGRNFSNKIWNAFRLVNGWEITKNADNPNNHLPIAWFEARYQQELATIEDHYSKYRLSDALMSVYKLMWNDFCSLYLEMVKPAYQQPIDEATYHATIRFFEQLMKVIHPFMPFITEEIWHAIAHRETADSLIVAAYPKIQTFDAGILADMALVIDIVTNMRNIRNEKQIAQKEKLPLLIKTADQHFYQTYGALIKKMAMVEEIRFVEEKPAGSTGFVMKADECYVPIADKIDVEKEREKLEKELSHAKGLLQSVTKKLSNDRFVSSAPPAVVAKEQQKLADASSKIKAIEEALETLQAL